MILSRNDKIAITPLGGVNYVGHNCFLYEHGNSLIVIDCGIRPQVCEDMADNWTSPPPRLDILDERLRENKSAIGIITHAHLDHIGAVAELARRKIPVHLSSWSKLMMERYSDNMAIPAGASFRAFDKYQTLKHGNFDISFVPLQHSIPGSYGVLIKMGGKNILHLADFKFNGLNESLEETRKIFREIRAKAGAINCLILDVLNIEMEGFTPPEQLVLYSLENIIRKARGRTIITFFSSNIQRMEGILDIARVQNRRVAVSGWGMRHSYNLLGGHFLAKNGSIILVSGSQGEDNSGLFRMSRGEHQFLRLSRKDTIVFSSRCIPGNEEKVQELLWNLRRKKVKVFLHEGEAKKLNLPSGFEECFAHVSGHGQKKDLLEVIEILEPETIIPFHAPEEKCKLFEEIVGGKQTKLVQVGDTLEI